MLVDFEKFMDICITSGISEPIRNLLTISYLLGKINGTDELCKCLDKSLADAAVEVTKTDLALLSHIWPGTKGPVE